MNAETAKKTLLLYRAGTADIEEPEFAEALQFVRQEDDLRRWFDDQCTVREMIRVRFKQISVPEGFKEQIISERPWKTLIVSGREVAALAGVLAMAVLLGILLLWSRPHPPEDRLAAFRGRMVSTALRAYGMDLATTDIDQIHAYLTEHHAPDSVLPAGLNKVTVAGCVATSWQGQPVSMICFKTGKSLPAGRTSDLWLFIIDRNSLPNAPWAKPEIATVNRVTTASWTLGEKTYVLAVEGGEELLQTYL